MPNLCLACLDVLKNVRKRQTCAYWVTTARRSWNVNCIFAYVHERGLSFENRLANVGKRLLFVGIRKETQRNAEVNFWFWTCSKFLACNSVLIKTLWKRWTFATWSFSVLDERSFIVRSASNQRRTFVYIFFDSISSCHQMGAYVFLPQYPYVTKWGRFVLSNKMIKAYFVLCSVVCPPCLSAIFTCKVTIRYNEI